MQWLSNPKVRLALIVNGLYFISLFTPTQPHTRPRLFSRTFENTEARAWPKKAPVYATLPPASRPSKAATWVNSGLDQLDVYLDEDLTLVKRPGHRLLLSPTFTTKASNPEAPDTILLRFVSHSAVETFSDTSSLTIWANGEYIWDNEPGGRYGTNAVRHSATADDGEVTETLGVAMPYEVFAGVISARKVILQLGPDTVELTADQVEALRDMHRRIPQRVEATPPPATDYRRSYETGRGPRINPSAPTTQPPAKRQ